VKGVREADDLVPLRRAVGIVIAARGLDRALHRFGARIGEEDGIRESAVDEALREMFALRTAV
jgi:hypothetical protein